MKKAAFIDHLKIKKERFDFFNILLLEEKGLGDIQRLPFSVRILVENLLRKMDGRIVREEDLRNLAGWQKKYDEPVEIPFHPARVLMQDFTGVPAVVDLAAIRDALKTLGGDPAKVNPLVPVDLIVDHSVQVDYFGTDDAVFQNVKK
ncbi:MAG: aconitate hydratase, partial [Deltaproteobacteria bacterium]